MKTKRRKMPDQNAESVAKALGKGKARRYKNSWMTLCPAHDDRNPSLQIWDTSGAIAVKCHAKCPTDKVISALAKKGYQKSALREPYGERKNQYIYRDSNGKEIMMVKRLTKDDGSKTFRQYRTDGKGGWISGIKGHVEQPPPYNLPKLLRAIQQDETIYIVEGEKHVDRLGEESLTATTNNGGAGKWKDHHSDFLKGARVVILPDNDEPGQKHGEHIARSLAGKAKEIKIIDLPNLPIKGDVIDFLDADGDVFDIEKLAEEAPTWETQDIIVPLVEQIEQSTLSSDLFINQKIRRPKALIRPWLRRGSLSMIYAERGTGKTWLGIVIAVVLTRETGDELMIGPWTTRNQCGTLYIDGEMGDYYFKDRLRKLTDNLPKESSKHPLMVLTTSSLGEKFGGSINLVDSEWRYAVSEWLDKHSEVKHIILDNVASLAPHLDENSKSDWDPIAQWLHSLRHRGVAVTLIHHAGKKGTQRGSSGREDSLDNVIRLSKPANHHSSLDG